MADTEFSALAPTNTIAATDSLLLARGGTPYRTTAVLPVIDAAGNFGFGATGALAKRVDVQTSTDRDGIRIAMRLVPTGSNGGALTFSSYTNTDLADMLQIQGVCTNGSAAYAGGLVVRTATSGALTEKLRIDGNGNVGVGTALPRTKLTVKPSSAPTDPVGRLPFEIGEDTDNPDYGIRQGIVFQSGTWTGVINVVTGGVGGPLCVNPSGGNLLVGATSGPCHMLVKGSGIADQILSITGQSQPCATFYSGGGSPPNSAIANMKIYGMNVTNRAINAGGTVNVNGADYAEYMTKAEGCGTIAPGDVCGVGTDRLLTRAWSEAISFVIKSTSPAYVGGDTWGQSVGPRPTEPIPTLPIYDGPPEPTPVPDFALEAPTAQPDPEQPVDTSGPQPTAPVRADGEGDVAWMQRVYVYVIADREWQQRKAIFAAAQAAYPDQLAAVQSANQDAQDAFQAAQQQHAQAVAAYDLAKGEYDTARAAYDAEIAAAEAAHDAAVTAYQADLTAWEAQHEAARLKVDRIAFSGQVPVNVDAATLAACEAALAVGIGVYLVAAANGGGIKAIAVTEADMTLELYMRRLGKVWAIREGRPWVDVQHG